MDMSSIERGSEKSRAPGQRALENLLVGFVFLISHLNGKKGRKLQYYGVWQLHFGLCSDARVITSQH